MTLIPFFAVLIAAGWLGEPLTLSLVGGGALTIGGMALAQRAGQGIVCYARLYIQDSGEGVCK